MNTLACIKKRRSIRKYLDKHIPSEVIHEIISCAMAAPSACNNRDWAFIYVDDENLINEMAKINGQAAKPLLAAKHGILVLADLSKAPEHARNYAIIDAAFAAENICLAACEMGLGTCMIGTYPQEGKMNGHKALFNLPDNLVPHTIIAIGYPDEAPDKRSPEFEEECYFYNGLKK